MINRTAELRRLLAEERFIDMPVAYDPLGGRLVESLGFKTVYNGGFVTGGSRCTSEPLLTMRTAGDIAKAVEVPVVADAGAGFGEPLHAMRTVREFIHAGIAGIHIEDQLYPKRAHYHKYVAHVIRQDQICLPPARRNRQGFRDHRAQRCLPLRGAGRGGDADQYGRRCRRRYGHDLPAHTGGARAGDKARQNPAGLGAQPRQPRQPPDPKLEATGRYGLLWATKPASMRCSTCWSVSIMRSRR
jgi:hypothetical protein